MALPESRPIGGPYRPQRRHDPARIRARTAQITGSFRYAKAGRASMREAVALLPDCAGCISPEMMDRVSARSFSARDWYSVAEHLLILSR
jgi:hypothetical protein